MNLKEKYRQLFLNPTQCEPLVVISAAPPSRYTIGEMIRDPAKMLESQLDNVKFHQEIGDDYLPSLRVNFGTAQIAQAFGCPTEILEDTYPPCTGHVLEAIAQADELPLPGFDNPFNRELVRFTQYFLEHKPADIPIQHPDVQSAFNSGHLIRGNDILFDFFDDPDHVKVLLRKVCDYMIEWIRWTKAPISDETDWFYDAGGYWKGGARISNCTMQIISPDQYRDFVMEEDIRFLNAVNGGRVHYCGSNSEVIRDFMRIDSAYTFEIDSQYHDLIEMCEICPPEKVMHFCDWSTDPGNRSWFDKIMAVDIPAKKNIVVLAKAASLDEAKRVYDMLKSKLC